MRRFRLFGVLILAALLTCFYTLTSSGRFHIVDEVSLFNVTASLAMRGAVDTNAIAWTQWVNSPGEVLGAFGPDGQVYSKKGPAPALVAVPWYLMLHLITNLNVRIGQLQSSLLWNGVLTAWTAVLLWLTALRLGYKDRTGMVLGLLFGLATIAWPYANQFFGEPLSAFSLLLCFYGVAAWRQRGHWLWLAVAGIGGALAITTVTAHALLIGIIGLWFVVDWLLRRRAGDAPSTGRFGLGLAAFAAPLVAGGLLLLVYNFIRFGNPLETGYHFDSGEGFTTPLFQGLWGLLVSPYRSVFLHTPLFIGSLLAFVPFWRRHRGEATLVAAMSVVLVAMYSTWWMWWGGFAWGPRFLVPLTPFWVLPLAPLIEAIRQPVRAKLRLSPLQWLVAVTAAASFIVQLAAVTVNFVNYEIALRGIFPTDWDDPLKYGPPAQAITDFFDSPVFGQFKLMATGFIVNTDLAWLWADGTVLWLVFIIGAAAVITLAGALWLWWRTAEQPEHASISIPTMAMVLAVPILVMAAWSGEVGQDPHYGKEGVGYRGIVRDICRSATTTGSFVNVVPTDYQIPFNWMPGECDVALPTYGYALDSLNHPEAQQVMQQVLQTYDRIWFATSGVQPNDPDNTLERWLAANAYKAIDLWYDTYRLVQYATPVRLSGVEERPIDTALLGRLAEQVTIASVRAPSIAPAGKPIPIEIRYRLEAETDQNLRWFVQLLSGQNIPLAQLDTGPEDNYTSFGSLPAHEMLIERAGLLVPENTPEGDYLLIAGLYNPDAGGARLVTVDGPDFVSLGSVRVVKGR